MYLNLTQIAESLGISEKLVERWIRDEGLPHTPDRGRLLFDRVQVAHWAATRGLAAKTGFLAPEAPAFSGGWQLEPLLRTGGIWRNVPSETLVEDFKQIVASLPGATPAIRQLLIQRLSTKDGLAYAPIGDGFALPHLSTRVTLGRESGTIALFLLREPLTLTGPMPDSVPITRLFFFVAPSPRAHLDLVGRLCRLLKLESTLQLILRGASDREIFRAVAEADKLGNGASIERKSL
jgi:PTS system nitrogen regulatory IIA component